MTPALDLRGLRKATEAELAARRRPIAHASAPVAPEHRPRVGNAPAGDSCGPGSASAPTGEKTEDGAQLLADILAFLTRFVAYPSVDAAVAHTLWIVHAHLMEEWESTPRLAFLSPEPGSGKTRALEVTERLVPRPVASVNATPAFLFRRVADPDGRPTLLYDEIDTVFGPRAKDNEEVRGLINAGHRRGATAGRCVVRGKVIETEELEAYCAVALAGIGNLPDTIITRSVVIRMRKRAPNERVEAWRARQHGPQGELLRDRLGRWATAMCGIGKTYPPMPEGVTDRAADVWEPLLAVADAVGGPWPERARVSAVSLVSLAREGNPSLGVRLLSDLRSVFGTSEAMFTETILEQLRALDEAPWGDLRGKTLDSRGLARLLRPYAVSPKQIRIGSAAAKGYTRADLQDPWCRYLGPSSATSETSETSDTARAAHGGREDGTADQHDQEQGVVEELVTAASGSIDESEVF